MKRIHLSFAASFVTAVMHTHKKAKPYQHPIFPSHIRNSLCILKFVLQKKDKDTLHGSISRKKTSVQDFGNRLGFSTSDSTSRFAINFIKLAKSFDPRSLKSCKYFSGKRDHTSFRYWLWKPRSFPGVFVLETNIYPTEDSKQNCPSSAQVVSSDMASICGPLSSASWRLNKIHSHRHRTTELQITCHLAMFTTY